MTYALALVRLLPLPFLGRLGIAFVEIMLAAIVVSSSVVLGHDLKAWRAWYWDPSTIRHWEATPAPTVAVAAAPAPICPPATADEDVAFASSAACVWFAAAGDGTHLVLETTWMAKTDVALAAPRDASPHLRVFAPVSATTPVFVVTGTSADRASVMIFTWSFPRGYVELLRAGGTRVDVMNGVGGWPAVTVTMPSGVSPRVHAFRWDGARFVEP